MPRPENIIHTQPHTIPVQIFVEGIASEKRQQNVLDDYQLTKLFSEEIPLSLLSLIWMRNHTVNEN